MHRSYLFAPGHSAKLVDRVFRAGADAVMLDLEDAVPADAKVQARRMVAEALGARPGWVRINALRSELAAADLWAVVPLAEGLRLPKVESAEDVQWVVDRCGPLIPPLICAIESARGLLAAKEIASVDGVRHLSMGGVDLRHDLNTGDGDLPMLHARSHLVVVSAAAGLAPPIDSVYPRLDDPDGLRAQAEFARSIGFFGKSAIHPRQLPVVHAVFTPSQDEIAWAHEVTRPPTAGPIESELSRCPRAIPSAAKGISPTSSSPVMASQRPAGSLTPSAAPQAYRTRMLSRGYRSRAKRARKRSTAAQTASTSRSSL